MTFKEYCKSRLPDNLQRLERLLKMDAPDLLLVAELLMLLNNAKGAFGPELVKAQLEYELRGIRQGWAYCQSCDNQVNVERSFHPICERCDADAEKYADEMNRELDKLEDEFRDESE